MGVEFEVIYWDRKDIEEVNNFKTHAFKYCIDDSQNKFKKLLPFISFRQFVKRVIKSQQYDFLLVLGTIPAVLLYNLLLKKYRGKFILDIRDMTYEHLAIYRYFASRLIKGSGLTCISSEGFKKALDPNAQYVVSHNTPSKDYLDVRETGRRHAEGKIRISFLGLIRNPKLNLRLIDIFGQDERFEIYYHGYGSEVISELTLYCNENNYDNIHFTGPYRPQEKEELIEQAHIIHNVYENDRVMTLATSNKYYDGLIYRIPQIVLKGSHMSELINSYVGLSIDLDNPDVAEEIYLWYKGLDWEEFDHSCTKALIKIRIDDLIFENKVRCLVMDG
jgi:hypothetical protein